jgi:hypothetical protein
MLVTHLAFFIQKHQGWHTAQFEQVDFLFVGIGHLVFGIGQANIRDVLRFPVTAKGCWAIRANGDDFRVTRGKGGILVAQGGEMRTAVRSHKTTQEDQNDVLLAAKIKQPHQISVDVGQLKIGRTLQLYRHRTLQILDNATCFDEQANKFQGVSNFKKPAVAWAVCPHWLAGEISAGLSPDW